VIAGPMNVTVWRCPRSVDTFQLALRELDRGPGFRTAHPGHARPAGPSLQDHRDERRKLQASGRHETVPNQKVLRESGIDHVPEADLHINHVWLFSTSGRGCFGPAFTHGDIYLLRARLPG
jgi:hypothetical protein